MKTFLIIFITIIISVILVIKLIKTPELEEKHSTISNTPAPNYSREQLVYEPNTKEYGSSNNEAEIPLSDHKLLAFAKAFVEVQTFMDKVGSKADYKETGKLVRKHGLSVDEYTKIAILMNKNQKFHDKVQRLINKVSE